MQMRHKLCNNTMMRGSHNCEVCARFIGRSNARERDAGSRQSEHRPELTSRQDVGSTSLDQDAYSRQIITIKNILMHEPTESEEGEIVAAKLLNDACMGHAC